ncbi:THO complex subunit 4 [Hesseltinella vesiculosa]|uniref:THO complex subunit 4 n=1 Tax=Hesseltinella vesiculosa TaxID=101127 RepID=A0A1X2GRD9_9FUNG|nr:THO complex subunit 4 [Hesseltinella vesiculosa]
MVANLHNRVNEKDLYELFGQIGKVNRAYIHLAPNGTSSGVANVVFKVASDAERALNTYNNVALDGNDPKTAK